MSVLDLAHLNFTLYRFDATDPRDKMYLILAIYTSGQNEALRLDCDLGVENGYIPFATHLIKK
jgi:hypothetical protein